MDMELQDTLDQDLGFFVEMHVVLLISGIGEDITLSV
jgi:hypothetical protein